MFYNLKQIFFLFFFYRCCLFCSCYNVLMIFCFRITLPDQCHNMHSIWCHNLYNLWCLFQRCVLYLWCLSVCAELKVKILNSCNCDVSILLERSYYLKKIKVISWYMFRLLHSITFFFFWFYMIVWLPVLSCSDSFLLDEIHCKGTVWWSLSLVSFSWYFSVLSTFKNGYILSSKLRISTLWLWFAIIFYLFMFSTCSLKLAS